MEDVYADGRKPLRDHLCVRIDNISKQQLCSDAKNFCIHPKIPILPFCVRMLPREHPVCRVRQKRMAREKYTGNSALFLQKQ